MRVHRVGSTAGQDARLAAAFEHGRLAERERLAQDLHDDLGARLLTLIVRARDPEMAESLRNALRDLKALARGLMAPRTRLSEAAADWKHEAEARMAEAGIELTWQVDIGQDATLSTELWFAITRVLRELLSNAIAHAEPTRVAVTGGLHAGWLELCVEDDGRGCAPERWAVGIGTSGVRRRIGHLGGSVTWTERHPHGIRCHVRLPVRQSPQDGTPRGGQQRARASHSTLAPVSTAPSDGHG